MYFLNSNEEIEGENKEMNKYSEFVKTNIKEGYSIIMEFLKDGEIEDEEKYCCIRSKIDGLRICIPKEISLEHNNEIRNYQNKCNN